MSSSLFRKWYNTNAATAAQMVHVSDDLIRQIADVEITEAVDYITGERAGSTQDPKFFGNPGDGNPTIGYISLANPVVNINYLTGSYPVLSEKLDITIKDLAGIIYFGKFVVTDPGSTKLHYKDILDHKEMADWKDSGAEILTGAKAVRALIEKENIDLPGAVLNYIPILPLDLRVIESDGKIYEYDIEYLYNRIIRRNGRIKKLKEFGCPAIILYNEGRMLQEYVDGLINNGAYHLPIKNNFGVSLKSLQETWKSISEFTVKPKKITLPEMFDGFDEEVFKSHFNEMMSLDDADFTLDENGNDVPANKAAEMLLSLADELRPLIDAVIDWNFADYKTEYYNLMVYVAESALHSPNSYILNYDPENNATDYFKRAIYSQINNFIQKRCMYEEVA